MLIIQKKSAVSVFYGLIAVDGEVGEEELQKLDELGHGLDPEGYEAYRDEVIAAWQAQQEKMIDDEDYYDVIAEGVQEALHDALDDPEKGMPSRLLLWDLLTLAFINDDYADVQRRLIKHVARIAGINASVFLEMEQLMQTYISVEKERALIRKSERPYAEIEPIVLELNDRIKVLTTAAESLIADELLEQNIEALVYKQGVFGKTMGALGEKMQPVFGGIGDKANEIMGAAKKQVGHGAAAALAGLGKQKDRLFGGLKSKKKNGGADNTDTSEEE